MPSVNYVLVYCTSCGERRKIAPEKAYEQRSFIELRWVTLRDLACPVSGCKGRMKPMPEYGEPLYFGQELWPMSPDVKWMA